MMKTTVIFFASLRERMGVSRLELTLPMEVVVDEVWRQATDGAVMPDNVLVAVNHEYVDRSCIVRAGDEVAFFPPVTGG